MMNEPTIDQPAFDNEINQKCGSLLAVPHLSAVQIESGNIEFNLQKHLLP